MRFLIYKHKTNPMKNTYLTILLLSYVLSSCAERTKYPRTPLDLFSTEINLLESNYGINDDFLATIYGIQCNDSSLIVLDSHSSKSFSLFNRQTGDFLGRFGSIGQGPGEIPLGCYGNLEGNIFTIFYDITGFIAKYDMDSLISNINLKPTTIMKYEFPEVFMSKIIPINDSVFFGAGVYKSEFQYMIFNKANEITDYKVEIFNARNGMYNMYHKFLSNQGILKKHPTQNKFVFSLIYSSNIDFVEVAKNEIHLIKSIRLNYPKFQAVQDNNINRVIPDKYNTIGYIDLATNGENVYALYTDKKMVDENGRGNLFCSNIILVFDWEGNPVKKYKLDHDAYYITVNEKLKKIYAAIKKADAGWSIISYDLN
jgi:hypothetical protein